MNANCPCHIYGITLKSLRHIVIKGNSITLVQFCLKILLDLWNIKRRLWPHMARIKKDCNLKKKATGNGNIPKKWVFFVLLLRKPLGVFLGILRAFCLRDKLFGLTFSAVLPKRKTSHTHNSHYNAISCTYQLKTSLKLALQDIFLAHKFHGEKLMKPIKLC